MEPFTDSHTLSEVIAAVAAYGCQYNIPEIVSELLTVVNVDKIDSITLHMFNLHRLYPDLEAKPKETIIEMLSSLMALERVVKKASIQGKIRTTLYHFKICYVNLFAVESEQPHKLIAYRNAIYECFPVTFTSSIPANVQQNSDTREIFLQTANNLTDFQRYGKHQAQQRIQRHKLLALTNLHKLFPILDEHLKLSYPADSFFGVNVADNEFWKQYEMYSGKTASVTDLEHLQEFASFLSSMHMRANLGDIEIAGTQALGAMDTTTNKSSASGTDAIENSQFCQTS